MFLCCRTFNSHQHKLLGETLQALACLCCILYLQHKLGCQSSCLCDNLKVSELEFDIWIHVCVSAAQNTFPPPWHLLEGHTASQRVQAARMGRVSESREPTSQERSGRKQDWRRWSTAGRHLRWCNTEAAACQTHPGEVGREKRALIVLKIMQMQ